MKLEQIMKEWEQDAVIDEMELGDASRKSATLHAKYLMELNMAKIQVKKADFSLKTLLKDKQLWYAGKLAKDIIDDYGWDYDPYDGLNKPLKGEMDYWYDADPDIQAHLLKIEQLKVKVNTLEEILNMIKWRHTQVKNAIDWAKFTSGI